MRQSDAVNVKLKTGQGLHLHSPSVFQSAMTDLLDPVHGVVEFVFGGPLGQTHAFQKDIIQEDNLNIEYKKCPI